jgi:hypothetical protein
MNIATYVRCKIAPDFEQSAKKFKFATEVWAVAAAFSKLPVAGNFFDIMNLTHLGEEEVKDSISELLKNGLIAQEVISWSDFGLLAKSSPAVVPRVQGGGGIRSSIGTITSIGGMPSAVKGVGTPGGLQSDSRNNSMGTDGVTRMRMGVIAVAQDSAELTKSWVGDMGQGAGEFAPASAVIGGVGSLSSMKANMGGGAALEAGSGKMYKLRPILAQIEKLCGGGIEGDLLVYQVFLRIPLNLLRAEGISSLHIVDDQTSFDSPELLEAISSATREVTGKTLTI